MVNEHEEANDLPRGDDGQPNEAEKESNELPKSEEEQSSVAEKEQLKALKERINNLTQLQQDRFYSLYNDFGERSFKAVASFDGKKVPGQWKKFTTELKLVNDLEDDWYPYFCDLTNYFKLDLPTGMFEIIYAVTELRKKHDRPQMSAQVTKDALADFGKVFQYDTGTDENGVYEYTPRFKKQFR